MWRRVTLAIIRHVSTAESCELAWTFIEMVRVMVPLFCFWGFAVMFQLCSVVGIGKGLFSPKRTLVQLPQLLHVSVTFKFVTWNRSEANECGCWFAVYYVCLYGKLMAMFEFKTDQYWSIPRGIWKTVRSSCFQWRRLFSPPEPGLEILLQVQTKRKSVGAALKGALKFPQWKTVYHYNVKMKETLGH